MNKVRVLLKAPILTQSGYGRHSRQIFESLCLNPAFEVYVESINWGQCSYITEQSELKNKIDQCIAKRIFDRQNNNNKYDLFVHVTIPNEFEKMGQFNIGVTAGIETDRVSHVWIQKCNEMDLIIVPSNHSKDVLVKTTVEWQNGDQRGQLKLSKPVEVCPEGVDSSIFRKLTQEEFESVKTISEIKFDSSFNFLHVGQWGGGNIGEDRKNIGALVKYFIESFLGRKDVGLVLKINMSKNSIADFRNIEFRLDQIKKAFPEKDVPPIYLLHANLSDAEMAALYNHPQIKAFVSLTHGEGFGLPLLEAAACQLPVIATNWSGHLDFLAQGNFSAVSYELKQIPAAAVWDGVLTKESMWAYPLEEDSKRRMKKMVSSYSVPSEWAKELSEKVAKNFDLKTTNQLFAMTIQRKIVEQESGVVSPEEYLQSLIDTPDNYNVLFTMPRSTGDVFVSTAVLDGLKKQLPEDAKVYFATSPQYAGVLKNNPNVHKVVAWQQWMIQVEVPEKVFDLVLTPDTATQYVFSNWLKKGQGRLLAEEYANHCNCELGEYFIDKEEVSGLPEKFMTFHPGSGKGQWEARRYDDWKEVLTNIKKAYPELKIVHVGGSDEPTYENVDVDLRGKTNHQQLAYVLSKSSLHLSIDTFSMHVAAALGIPLVALFGCSYAQATGPWVKDREKAKFILLQSERLSGCKDRACYKDKCAVNPENPPINEIDPKDVFESCCSLLGTAQKAHTSYARIYGKISGYTTTYNALDYPFRQSIESMLGFCDEVVVVDGCSTDGTWEKLEQMAANEPRLKLYQNEFDWTEPGMDGMQKAFARALCENEFLWQMDVDEVVHENDYEKIKMITKRFPKEDILHLPVVELWGDPNHVTGRRHNWKWRMSRNKPEITHGINAAARVVNEQTGKVFAKKGMSDGCEYVNVMNYQMLPHVGFYNQQLELARVHMPQEFARVSNEIFQHIPSVYHYSWCDIPRKINQLKKGGVWDKMWSLLYGEETQERFPGVETEEQVLELAKKLEEQGGEDSDNVKYKFELKKSQPKNMEGWKK